MKIESLEDYQKVKAELKDKQWRKDNLHGSAEFTWHMKQHIQLLEAVLLQYRREHGIYEKGDWVASKKVGTVGDFIKEIDLKSGNKHCFVDIGLSDSVIFCMEHIRHATPEEIQANRRLEVCGG